MTYTGGAPRNKSEATNSLARVFSKPSNKEIIRNIRAKQSHEVSDAQYLSSKLARFLPSDIAFLLKFGVPYSHLRQAHDLAIENGTEACVELIASGHIDEDFYCSALAEALGVPHYNSSKVKPVTHTDPDQALAAYNKGTYINFREGKHTRTLVRPMSNDVQRLHFLKRTNPEALERFAIISSANFKTVLSNIFQRHLVKRAAFNLHLASPLFSSKNVIKPAQIVSLFVVVLSVISAVFWGPTWVGGAIALAASLFFLAGTIMRLLAALGFDLNKKQIIDTSERNQPAELPVYSVLVAVYKEANVLPDLLKHLSRLDWPRSKLDIKIIAEANDNATIAAFERLADQYPLIELLKVPEHKPKTKPKALNYGLALTRGEYVAIYDAEDRPSPGQLQEAYNRFRNGPNDLACLQAPLLIDNTWENWLTNMFSLEYNTLFDGLLPALASWSLPLPLGGTSNHFRKDFLVKVGGWDPFNVTEDADLGLRLGRLGYRTDVIDSPTYEEAPNTFNIWVKQRTRWFKGWMQTWLVHTRQPIRAFKDLGWQRFLGYHLIMSGVLFSALLHPFCMAFVIYYLTIGDFSQNLLTNWVFWAVQGNLALAYLSYGLLAYKSLKYRGKLRLLWLLTTAPFYWLMQSFPAWRAFFQLFHAPHLWEKAPHGKSRKRQAII